MRQRQTDIEAVRLDIDERGARIAYDALLEVCQDKKAPAQAKAAAGVAVLRAGGLYDAKRRPALDEDPATLSAEELQRSVAALTREADRLDAVIAERQASLDEDDEDPTDVFA